MSFVPLKDKSPAEQRDFLLYYAGVMEREADARPGQNCDWMRSGAERAKREAAAIDQTPAQGDLFGAPQ
ncbi:hypothetical protein [Devosia ginsengisoli]|uniref:hypothetical protein n=1 Tax=Devosia ginsengisoli TaxID=400770 RepID=UPI0026F1C8DB|nr:hypothetical protein [Devosia ginsengisoli]MCR6673265.1 hypothetical protein [Devosia ginsengisoli]